MSTDAHHALVHERVSGGPQVLKSFVEFRLVFQAVTGECVQKSVELFGNIWFFPIIVAIVDELPELRSKPVGWRENIQRSTDKNLKGGGGKDNRWHNVGKLSLRIEK